MSGAAWMRLPNGRTSLEHVEYSLTEAAALLSRASTVIRSGKPLKPAKRLELWRQLAGVVSGVESVRAWLDAGAPIIRLPGEQPLPFEGGGELPAPYHEIEVVDGTIVRDQRNAYIKEQFYPQRVDEPLPEPPVSWS